MADRLTLIANSSLNSYGTLICQSMFSTMRSGSTTKKQAYQLTLIYDFDSTYLGSIIHLSVFSNTRSGSRPVIKKKVPELQLALFV